MGFAAPSVSASPMSPTPSASETAGPPPASPSTIPESLRALAAEAGFAFDGDAPWDVRVRDPRLFRRILAQGSLGFGEAYMDGWWECDRIDELFHRLLRRPRKHLGLAMQARLIGDSLRHGLFNRQTHTRAFEVGKRHYDIGNDVFEAMLDPTMTYSCGYWRDATTLDAAQLAKLDLICRKLELRPGERLLDIGCGWGGLAAHAAHRYGVEVFGITVSAEQQKLARERCAGLPVAIELMDYRKLEGRWDKVVSVGMFEHVGPKNYAEYFDMASRVLGEDGLFLLHTIGNDRTSNTPDPWIDRYIFPNGVLPSAAQIAAAADHRLIIDDWHNFGTDYDLTLMAWWSNFERAWPRLADKYGERFHRMWKYYLMSCAGYFRSRRGQLWQVVLSKRSRSDGYRSLR